MGLDLGLVPTDEVLIQMVKRLAEDYPNRGSVCMFIAKQIKEHDYLGAATTISLSFPQGNDFLDDLPKLLVALSNPPACDYNNLLYILYDILGDISEDGDDFELGQDSYQGFGSYRSVHYFRTFVTLAVKHWRETSKLLSMNDTLRTLNISMHLAYDPCVCPNLSEHSDCDGYYLPFYAKPPINYMFGSLYGLAEELVEFHRTGALCVLSELPHHRLGFYAHLADYAKFVEDRYIMLLRFIVTALEFDDTLSFC